MIRTRKKFNLESLYWIILIISALLTTFLPSISTAIGVLYPYRILLPIFLLYLGSKKNLRIGFAFFSIICFSLLLIYGAASIIWAQQKIPAQQSLLNYIYSIMCIIVFSLVCSKKTIIEKMVLIIWICLVAICFCGLYESFTGNYMMHHDYITGNKFLDYAHINSFGLYVPITFFYNTNDFALLLVLFIPLILGYASNKTKKIQFFAFLTLLLFIVMNVLSQARTCLILYGIYFYLWLILTRKRTWFIFVTLLIIIFSIIFFKEIIDILGLSQSSLMNNPRIIIWKNALVSFYRSFGFGVGIGNSAYPLKNVIYEGVVTNTHFWLLEILVEFGLFIFIVIIYWYFSSLKELNKAKKDRLGLAFFVGMITMPLWGMISSSISVMPFVWIYFGLMIAFVNLHQAEIRRRRNRV